MVLVRAPGHLAVGLDPTTCRAVSFVRHTQAMTDVQPPDPLHYARRWARVVIWQIGRVREVRDVQPAHRVGDRPGFFDRLGAEQHFLLVATTQLSRSLSALEHEGLDLAHQTDLTLLRNVREHWDEWEIDKRSPAQFRELWPGKSPWTLTASSGDLSLAGLVSLTSLEASARTILAALDALAAGYDGT